MKQGVDRRAAGTGTIAALSVLGNGSCEIPW